MLIDARTAVLNLAKALLWVRETNGSNRSGIIDEMIRLTSLDPTKRLPWCAAFVAWVGYAVNHKGWPLKKVAGCMSLYDDARAKGIVRTIPEPGAIGLLWGRGPDGVLRYKHALFVVEKLPDGKWLTREGNTNEVGSAEGDGVFEQKRTFGPKDVFIYWWEAMPTPVPQGLAA